MSDKENYNTRFIQTKITEQKRERKRTQQIKIMFTIATYVINLLSVNDGSIGIFWFKYLQRHSELKIGIE